MNTAHDLFLLMFNLTQVHDRDKLIEMFLDGLHEIFEPAVFQFTKESIEENPFDIEIKTRRSHFGFIRIRGFKNKPKEYLPLIQNATQMLAVMLERLYFDRQLQEEKNSLEQIAEERNKDLQKKIKELEQAKNTSLNLVKDLKEEIKKRTRYEKELKESEERFRLVMENSLDAILITSPDGSILSANPAACKMFGMTQKEIYNAGRNGLVDKNDPNLPKLLAEREETGNTKGELAFIRKDGTRFTAELSTSVFYNSKNELRTSMIIRDITERKKAEEEILRAKEKVEISEERFRKAQEVGHIGSWEYDLQNDTFWGSEEGKKIYNLTHKKDEFTPQEVMQCVIEQDRDRVNQAMIDLVNKNKTYDITFTIVPKNTSERKVVRSIAELQKDENGKPVKVLGILHDITLQKTIEKELIEAKEKAEESERLKTAFLANMSHEIRTPMNGILGFTDVLRESDLTSEEKNEYVEIIHRSGQRMMNTVNDIVEMSKIEAGIVTTDRQETNLNNHLNDVIQFFRPEAQKKGMELNLDQILPENRSTIITDAHKFEAILTNLVKNAIKYTDEGQINVGADIKKDWIEFYVKDTGIGVPKHRQEAIFNRFEQADIKDTRAFEGSGLGLAISKSYIGMLGGEIWLESEENKGSVFYFTLPLQKGKKTKPTATSNEPTESSNQKHIETPDKKLKVLVAEDDEESFIYLTTILKKYNWNIIHAETGRQTIEKYREQPDIDLILMDIKLPDIDGYEATRRIKEINPDVPIIAQTAYALEGDRQKALRAGCDEYISKPMKKETLLDLVNQVLIE